MKNTTNIEHHEKCINCGKMVVPPYVYSFEGRYPLCFECFFRLSKKERRKEPKKRS